MSWTHKSLILPGVLAIACSVINQFDDVGEILPDGGAGSTSGGSGGKGGNDGGSAGSSGGSAGKGGSKAAGGEAGGGPVEPLVGAIVVAERVGTGTQAENHLIVIDPADGSEVDRIDTEQQIHAIGYEAARNKWFIFTGTTGAGGPSTVFVGSVTRAGFEPEGMTEVPDGKPTGQSTMTVLNRRIVYRTVQSNGIDTADKLVLMNTENLGSLTILGSVDIPAEDRVFATLGRPGTGTSPGGRVTFIHFNRANSPVSGCMIPDGGVETVCPVRTSSVPVTAQHTAPPVPATLRFVDWISQSGSNPSGATEMKATGFDYIVVPPEKAEGSTATVYKFGSSGPAGQVDFDLGTLGSPTDSVSMSATIIDPCVERVVTAEQANTRKLYAVPFQQMPTTADVALNAPGGGLAYEPHTKTVIQFFQDPTNPSFRGFELGGTAEAPTLTERGTGTARPWTPPAGMNPAIVVTETPLTPPCN